MAVRRVQVLSEVRVDSQACMELQFILSNRTLQTAAGSDKGDPVHLNLFIMDVTSSDGSGLRQWLFH